MRHFIFGYGSLICQQSRSITAPTLQDAIAEPVIISHIERIWAARVQKINPVAGKSRDHIRGWTPMGIRRRHGASCNGVLIHVDEEELARFDVREEGYQRHRIDLIDVYPHCESTDSSSAADAVVTNAVRCPECNIVFEKAHKKRTYNNNLDESDIDIAVWVYIQNDQAAPNRSYPITQSYVDIIMRGCLSVSKVFARKFLDTTHGWWNDGDSDGLSTSRNTHHTWVDDRQSPTYARADSDFSMEHGDAIDRLIEEHHPHALKKRVISM